MASSAITMVETPASFFGDQFSTVAKFRSVGLILVMTNGDHQHSRILGSKDYIPVLEDVVYSLFVSLISNIMIGDAALQ